MKKSEQKAVNSDFVTNCLWCTHENILHAMHISGSFSFFLTFLWQNKYTPTGMRMNVFLLVKV